MPSSTSSCGTPSILTPRNGGCVSDRERASRIPLQTSQLDVIFGKHDLEVPRLVTEPHRRNGNRAILEIRSRHGRSHLLEQVHGISGPICRFWLCRFWATRFLSDDESKLYIVGLLEDSAAVMHHLTSMGDMIGRFSEIAPTARLEIYGDVSDELRELVAPFGPEIAGHLNGFTR